MANRNYRAEYDRYQGKPEQIANRAKRNAARAEMEKKGIVPADPGGTPDTFRKIVAGDLARWTRVVQTARIKVE